MSKKRQLTAEEIRMAARIKAAIEAIPGMTEERVGTELGGLSQGAVSHWTGARLPVPARRAAPLAALLNISDPSEISVAYREILRASSSAPSPDSQSAPLDPAVVDATHAAMRSYYKTKHQDYPEEVVARFLLVYTKLVLRKAGATEAELLSAELHDITAQGEIGDGGSAAGVRGKGDHARTVARRVRKA